MLLHERPQCITYITLLALQLLVVLISFTDRSRSAAENLAHQISFIYYSVRLAPPFAHRKKLDFNRFDFSEKYGEARDRGRARDGSIKTKSISIFALVRNISQIAGALV